MTFELWSNAQLLDAVETLMDRAERDEALRAELAAQLENSGTIHASSIFPNPEASVRGGSVMAHYHIRWSSGKLDWERYGSRVEAESGAKKLMLLRETYTIEAHAELCRRCPEVLRVRTRG